MPLLFIGRKIDFDGNKQKKIQRMLALFHVLPCRVRNQVERIKTMEQFIHRKYTRMESVEFSILESRSI